MTTPLAAESVLHTESWRRLSATARLLYFSFLAEFGGSSFDMPPIITLEGWCAQNYRRIAAALDTLRNEHYLATMPNGQSIITHPE